MSDEQGSTVDPPNLLTAAPGRQGEILVQILAACGGSSVMFHAGARHWSLTSRTALQSGIGREQR